MTPSENNRRARVYTLTRAGRRRLETENASWERFVLSVGRILNAE
jgi:DNA-binding MarR family transcriptional regulator